MATILGHTLTGAALGTAFADDRWSRRAYVLGAFAAIVPDFDLFGSILGIPAEHILGHRGFSHSLSAAVLIGLLVMVLGFRRKEWRWRLGLYLCAAAISHGMLDAMTSGGQAVAFFSAFWNERYFFPWRPLQVSPVIISFLFSSRMAGVLAIEVFRIYLPAGAFTMLMLALRDHRNHKKSQVEES